MALLTIAVSSRALFHIEDGNKIFEEQGKEAFDAYMREKENTPLRPGVAFNIVKKLLRLNTTSFPEPPDRVNVVLLSRNSPEAGLRVMNSIAHYKLEIERAAFSQGRDRFRYAKALGAHLFLSANPGDVKLALENGLAAATMVPKETDENFDEQALNIAFDGDSVLFSDEADDVYRAHGLVAFRNSETQNADNPLGDGPFRHLIEALHKLQKECAQAQAIRIALVTARGMPAHSRPIKTLRSWGIEVDEMIFAGGADKGPLLQAFGADIFFDDTQRNIDSAQSCDIISGHVPFGSGGITAQPEKAPIPVAA